MKKIVLILLLCIVTGTAYGEDPVFMVQTDRDVYGISDTITVSGVVPTDARFMHDSGHKLRLVEPDGDILFYDVSPGPDGSFSIQMPANTIFVGEGMYTVQVKFGPFGDTAQFHVTGKDVVHTPDAIPGTIPNTQHDLDLATKIVCGEQEPPGFCYGYRDVTSFLTALWGLIYTILLWLGLPIGIIVLLIYLVYRAGKRGNRTVSTAVLRTNKGTKAVTRKSNFFGKHVAQRPQEFHHEPVPDDGRPLIADTNVILDMIKWTDRMGVRNVIRDRIIIPDTVRNELYGILHGQNKAKFDATQFDYTTCVRDVPDHISYLDKLEKIHYDAMLQNDTLAKKWVASKKTYLENKGINTEYVTEDTLKQLYDAAESDRELAAKAAAMSQQYDTGAYLVTNDGDLLTFKQEILDVSGGKLYVIHGDSLL